MVWPTIRGRPARSGFLRWGKGPCREDSISAKVVRRDCAISHESFKLGFQYTALRTRSTKSPGRLTVSRTIRGLAALSRAAWRTDQAPSDAQAWWNDSELAAQ